MEKLILASSDDLTMHKDYVLKTFSGTVAAFSNAIAICAVDRKSGHTVLAGSWNNNSVILAMDTPKPILIDYLNEFKQFPKEIRDGIQRTILYEHPETNHLLDGHREDIKSFQIKKLETFAFCSNARLKSNEEGRILFVAVTGPTREFSEGTVVATAGEDGAHVVTLSSRFGTADVFKSYLTDVLSQPALNELQEFINDVDE